ncbi:MAG TPA: methyltransferase domain-containing protein [Actinomycetota bacterium]|nr:methyltransferase domain-containing protein [Actinomycetota bacterium]
MRQRATAARARTAAEGLEVAFEGDAERLSFPDASFEAVLSRLGVMVTRDQEQAASGGDRHPPVTRPG